MWFVLESGTPIKYRRLDREARLVRLRRLNDHWREHAPIDGDVGAIEVAVRAEFEGVVLPMVGYADVVVRSGEEIHVVDFKVGASTRTQDPVMDGLDVQLLALTRGYEIEGGEPVSGWAWQHLIKTNEPKVVTNAVAVSGCDRVHDVRRLAALVNPTVAAMRRVLDQDVAPVPTVAPFTMCGTCPYRAPCAACMTRRERSR